MANTYVPDQSDDFRRSGVRLITDPASDALLKKSERLRTGKTNGSPEFDNAQVRQNDEAL